MGLYGPTCLSIGYNTRTKSPLLELCNVLTSTAQGAPMTPLSHGGARE